MDDIIFIFMMVLLLVACTSETAPAKPIPTQASKTTPSSSLMTTLPEGGLVYSDLGDRFSLALVGDWTQVETNGSYGYFRLAEPEYEMYVVTVESEDSDAVTNWN